MASPWPAGSQPALFITALDEQPAAAATGGGVAESQMRRIELAEELGEAPERIRTLRPDWQALTRKVIVVDLSIGYYRSRHRLTAEDLGLSEAQKNDPEYAAALREAVTLGNKKLLPPHVIGRAEEIESQARYSLEKVSLKSGFGRLVPRGLYLELRIRLEQLRDEFFTVRDELIAGYDELAPEILERFRRIGRGALAQQRASGVPFDDEAGWIEQYAQRHLALLPPRDAIASSFQFEWLPAYLATSSEIAEDQALGEQRRLEAQVQNELLRLQSQNVRYQADFNYREKQMELEAVRRERERDEALDREIQQAKRQRQLELIDGTFREISSQLHEAVYEVCLDVLQSMQRKGRVVRNSSRQIKGLVERLRTLNVCDDAELQAVARQMEAIVGSNAKRRDARAISEVLAEIGTLTRASLLATGRTPRSGAALAIPDAVDAGRRGSAARRVVAPPPSFELLAVRRRGQRLSAASLPLAGAA